MAALTFDDIPSGGKTPEGRTRLYVNAGDVPAKSRALTFDDITPESTLAQAGKFIMGAGKAAASGLDKGVAGLAGMPADAALFVEDSLNWGKSKAQGRPLPEIEAESRKNAIISRESIEPWTGRAAHEKSPLRHEPQSRTEKYIQSAAEFVPSALIPGASVRNAVTLGVLPGLASEGAGHATEGSPVEPYARGAAALAAGGAGMWLNAPNSAGAAVSRAARGANQAQLDEAERLFNDAQRMGAPITRAEAIQHVTGGATNLGNLQRVVEGSGEMRPFMAQRAGQVDDAARQQFDQALGPASAAPSNIGPQLGEAATGVVQDVGAAINRHTRPLYDAARRDLVPEVQYQALANDPRYVEALRTVRNHPEIGPEFAGFPDNAVPVVDQVKKLLNTRSEVTPVADATERYLASLRGTAGTNATNAGTTASAPYAQALAEQARLREQYLRPLMSGPIGKLAAKDPTTKRAIEILFPSNPVANEREITQAVTALANRSPGAAREVVRAHVERTFNESVQRLQSGANEFGGAGFAAVLRGNPQQAANLEAAVTALRGGQAYQGFNRFLEVLEAQGTRQRIGSQTAFNQEVQSALKEGGTVASVVTGAATGGLKAPQQIRDAIQRWRLGQNVGQIADVLTNPASAQLFRQLATAPANSARAAAITTRLVHMATQDERTR